MSNLRDLNSRSNPVVDFLQAVTAQAQEHPFFAAYSPEGRDRGDGGAPPPEYEDPPASVPDGPPPPPSGEGPVPPQSSGQGPPPHRHGHRGPHHGPHHGPPSHGDDPFSGHGFPFGGPWGGSFGGRGHHGGPCRGSRGGWGGRGGGRCGGRRGGNPFEAWGGNAGNFDMSKLGEFISQFAPGFAPEASNNKENSRAGSESKDFQPPVDIFDTQDAYIVHVSLPGAKKEDVGVNWDADKSELSIAGVIYRPGDEETLKTLALDEREVGAFERKITLGTKLSPAQVDAEGISAKMEDGVLIVNIPKLEQDFVEVKKVEIE